MIRSTLSCAIALSLSATFALAGDLNPPPGPVAPTFKTLDEVEPSTPINTLPGSGLAVHEITQPGAYHLTGNITSPGAGMHAIRSLAEGVTIDLNGFAIIGDTTETLPAIQLTTANRVHNGTIDNWGGGGVRTVSSAVIEDIILDFVRGGPSIDVDRGCVIRRCTFRACNFMVLDDGTLLSEIHTRDMAEAIVSPDARGVTIMNSFFDGQNTAGFDSVIVLGDDAKLANVTVSEEGNTGLTAGDNASVIACTFSGNNTTNNPGLLLRNNALVRDCSISSYGGFGIESNFGGVFTNNAVFDNGGGISCLVTAQISGNSIYANSGDAIVVSNGATITGNVVRNNGGNGLVASSDCLITNNQFVNDPVVLQATGNTFDQNSVTSAGITLNAGDNRVTRNTVTGSITAPAGNIIGIVRTSATFGSAGPWDNFNP